MAEIEEKYGLDMSSYQDLPAVDCNAKDDYVFINGSDAGSGSGSGSDDLVGNEELAIVNGSAHDQPNFSHDKLELGGTAQINEHTVRHQSAELVKQNVEVNPKADLVFQDDQLVKAENGGSDVHVNVKNLHVVEVNPKDDLVFQDAQLAENGGSDIDVIAKQLHVVEVNHTNDNGDICNSSVDETTTLVLDNDHDDDDKVRIPLGTDESSGALSHKDENVLNGISATPLVSDVDTEHQHRVETQRDEGQGDDLNSPPVVEDNNVQPLVNEIRNPELEPLDNTSEDLKPFEGEIGRQTLEVGVLETQPLYGEVKVSHLSAGSEHFQPDAESKEPSEADSVTENQSSYCQQQELGCAEVDTQVAPDEEGDEVKEKGKSDASIVSIKQERDSMDSEIVRYDVNQSEECETTKVQNTEELNSESHEIQELQRYAVQSEEAENQSNELGQNDAEIEVTEQGDLDLPNTTVSQEVNDLDSDAVRCELDQNEEGEFVVRNTTELTADTKEIKGPQTDPIQFEEAENQVVIESAAPSVEGPISDCTASDGTAHVDIIGEGDLIAEVEEICATSPGDIDCITAEKRQVDCKTEKVDSDEKSEASVEAVANQESPVGDDIYVDQVAEDTSSVNGTDKEVCLEHIDVEKNVVLEEVTNLSEVQGEIGASVDEDQSNLDTVGLSENEINEDLVNDSQTVPASGHICDDGEGSSKSEGDDSSIPVDCAKYYPGSSDVDTIIEQVVVDTASANDICYQSNLEIGNGSHNDHVHDNDLEITAANGEIDVASNSSSVSSDSIKPKISFGSFVCEAPFSVNDVSVRPEISNRSSKLTNGLSHVTGENSESKIKHSNGVAILNVEANGVDFIGLNYDKTCHELSSVENDNADEVSSLPLAEHGPGAFQGQNIESGRRPFYYLIRVPRYEDEKLKELIRLSELQVDEKTQIRDTIRNEYQNRKGAIIPLKSDLEATKSEERAARDLVRTKRREIDSSLSLINLAKNAVTVEDVQAQILSMEHKIQHETLHLKEEKQLVREIKQMRNLKDQLSANAPKQEELKQALEQRVQVEERLKVLRKESASLRDNLSKAEECVKVARKKYDEESASLNELLNQYRSADAVRQDAYAHLLHLRKQWSEKNKPFWSYKDDARAAYDFVVAGDKDNLDRHCANQVEKFMEAWNKNDEFRKEYIKINTRSTLRRLRTHDGRALGPDEEPPSLGNLYDGRVTVSPRKNLVPVVSTIERNTPIVAKNVEDNFSKKLTEEKSKMVVAKKMPTEATSKSSLAEASSTIEIEEKKEDCNITKEEEELARKAEQLIKEEEAARLRQQRREEEKAKLKEAIVRKTRMMGKAQARAEFRAQKEAELKEKERERRAKKKEKKKDLTSKTSESESVIPESQESPSETTRETEVVEKAVSVGKKAKKASLYAKQMKSTKSIPPPLRNRGKRRIQQWMWALATAVAVLALFFLGNVKFLRNIGLLGFGPTNN